MQDITTSQLSLYLSGSGVPDFILNILSKPQILLAFMYKSKNNIQALLKQQVVILNDMLSSIEYIKNVEKTLPGNLVEAQTAILQSTYAGTVDVSKYKDKITSFLNPANIRSGSSESFGKTNIDSKEDITSDIQTFKGLQAQLDTAISSFNNIEEDLKSIDIVKTITKNLSSSISERLPTLNDNKDQVSKIGLSIDLFSSVSALQFINSLDINNGVFAPLVSNTIPADLNIVGISESIKATALSNVYPQSTTHSDFKFTVDGTVYAIDFPSIVAKGRKYVVSTQSSTSYTIPANRRLYVKVTCPTLPQQQVLLPENILTPPGVIGIDVPAGTYTVSSIANIITSGLNVVDTGAVLTQFGFCSEFGKIGSNRLMIYGKSDVTNIEIVPEPGVYNTITFLYVSAKASCHNELFLQFGSTPTLSYQDLRDCVNYYYPITLEENRLRLSSGTSGPNSTLTFQTSISTDIGFTNFVPIVNSFSLNSKGTTLNPRDFGLYDGVIFQGPLTINGNDLIGNSPYGTFNVIIYPDLIKLRDILSLTKSYKSPIEFDSVWSPILSDPSPAQILAAKAYTKNLISYLQDYINKLEYTAKDSPILKVANDLLNLLESKNLTALISYLNNSQFSKFFNAALNENDSSLGLTLMKTIEDGVKNGN